MIQFKNPDELFNWVREVREAERPLKASWQREVAIDMSYYEGHGWTQPVGWYSNEIERLKVDLNPDSPTFRATLNRTTSLVQRAAVSTQPISLNVQCFPPARNIGTMSSVKCQLDEDLCNTLIDHTGLLNCWGDANFMRSVIGCAGLGLTMRSGSRKLVMGDQEMDAPDSQVKAFSFLPLKLVLDPQNQNRDLEHHDYVIYQDVWTIHKINRIYGKMMQENNIVVDEQSLLPLGQLNCFELTINALTQNRLYSQYRWHSRTKGMIVSQVHRKDDRGRWAFTDIILEPQQNKMILLNPDDNESPWGGCGLPFVLLHGHRRADSMYSIGETRMLKDDQDRLNRTQTSYDRQMINSSKHQWVADRRGLGWVKSPKEQERLFTNRVGGVILYESGTRESPVERPQLVNIPPPQSALREMIGMYEDSMRGQIHTAPGNFGELQTHVPNASFQRAMEEAGQVLDGRVHEDKTAGERLLTVLLGTTKKLMMEGNPSTLALLDQHGFTTEDLMLMMEDDPHYPENTVSIRDGSIRVRSWNAKMQALDSALQAQAISPQDYRRELASTLDSPLTQDDKLFATSFEKIARQVLVGDAEFVPMPISRGQELVQTLERALLDPIAMRDPMAKQRVLDAVQLQRGIMMQMAMEEAAAQQQATQPPQPQQPVAEDQAEMSFETLVEQLASQASAA